MDIRRLQVFLRIAEEGSMSRAARLLGLAQPALSRQMRLLEEALGVALFTRTARGMELTEAGEQLRASMAGPLRQIELAMQNVGSPFAQLEGGVVFGVLPTTANLLAAPLLGRFVAAFPRVRFHLVDRESAALVEGMLKGEIDVALIQGPSPDVRLFESDLLVEDLVLVGGPNAGLAPDGPVPFARLGDVPLVLPGAQSSIRGLVEKTALRTRTTLDIRLEADSLPLTKELVAAGTLHTVLPVSAFVRELDDGRLRHAPIRDPALTRSLVLATRPQLVMPRAFVNELGVLVRREVAGLVRSGRWPATLSFATG